MALSSRWCAVRLGNHLLKIGEGGMEHTQR